MKLDKRIIALLTLANIVSELSGPQSIDINQRAMFGDQGLVTRHRIIHSALGQLWIDDQRHFIISWHKAFPLDVRLKSSFF